MKRLAFGLGLIALASCTTETVVEMQVVQGTAVDHGRALFSDPTASLSPINTFSCATCHRADTGPAALLLPGARWERAWYDGSNLAGEEHDCERARCSLRHLHSGPRPHPARDDGGELGCVPPPPHSKP